MDMDTLTNNFSSLGLLVFYIIVGVGAIVLGYYATRNDERTARSNGVHVKSKRRELALASELTPCVSERSTSQTDPYDYLFPSIADRCEPQKIEMEKNTEQQSQSNK